MSGADRSSLMLSANRSRAGKRSRARGARGELEVRDLLREFGWVDAHRQFQSGGQGGGDLADAIPDVHLEVKFTERLLLPLAWRQACAAARPTDMVVVVHRGNMQPWMATVRLLDLVDDEVFRRRSSLWFPRVARVGVRAEFMALFRVHSAKALVISQMGDDVMGTLLFSDLLALLKR